MILQLLQEDQNFMTVKSSTPKGATAISQLSQEDQNFLTMKNSKNGMFAALPLSQEDQKFMIVKNSKNVHHMLAALPPFGFSPQEFAVRRDVRQLLCEPVLGVPLWFV